MWREASIFQYGLPCHFFHFDFRLCLCCFETTPAEKSTSHPRMKNTPPMGVIGPIAPRKESIPKTLDMAKR